MGVRSHGPCTDIAQTEKYLRQMIASKWNGFCDFVLEYTPPSAKPRVIGKLGLWDGHEIGFMLNRAFWGQGLMKRAMNRFLRHLWNKKKMEGINKIVADVDPRNYASISLLKRFGFKETGYRERTFETNLGWCDSIDLELKRPGRTES